MIRRLTQYSFALMLLAAPSGIAMARDVSIASSNVWCRAMYLDTGIRMRFACSGAATLLDHTRNKLVSCNFSIQAAYNPDSTGKKLNFARSYVDNATCFKDGTTIPDVAREKLLATAGAVPQTYPDPTNKNTFGYAFFTSNPNRDTIKICLQAYFGGQVAQPYCRDLPEAADF